MYWASTDAYAYKYCSDTPEGIVAADGPGKDPVYGREAKPCSLVQIEELRARDRKIEHPRPVSVEDPESFNWFDSLTGKPSVFYAVLSNGKYVFFDRAGNDPGSGQPLRPITPEIVLHERQQKVAELQQQQIEQEQKQRLANAEALKVKQRQEKDEQVSARAIRTASMEALATQAGEEFDARQYKAAIQDCDRVVAEDRGNKGCLTIRLRASVKLAQDLVTRGQLEIQRGKFDEALWSAEEAINLDPANTNAVKLKELARQLKPHSFN